MPTQSEGALDRDDVYRRVLWKIVPFLLVGYLICRIDTAIVGYAKLEFVRQLHFSEAVYGFGAGVFYLGYALCEVPSNLYLERYGVRRTLLRIMTLWGAITVAMMFMRDSTQCVLARFFLGMAEGGVFPGILLYLTFWLPPDKRATGFSIFIMANPIAGAIGGVLSGLVMKKAGAALGLAGWQALFLSMGLPAIVLGIVSYFYLVDRPETAPWLNSTEKALIARETATLGVTCH